MSNHYGFFLSEGNEVFHSIRGIALLPNTSYGGDKHHIKGLGTYMYDNNIRQSICLFSVRSLTKHTWINDQDRYIGK